MVFFSEAKLRKCAKVQKSHYLIKLKMKKKIVCSKVCVSVYVSHRIVATDHNCRGHFHYSHLLLSNWMSFKWKKITLIHIMKIGVRLDDDNSDLIEALKWSTISQLIHRNCVRSSDRETLSPVQTVIWIVCSTFAGDDLVKSRTCDVAQGERVAIIFLANTNVKVFIRNLIETAIMLWLTIKTISLDFERKEVKTEVQVYCTNVTMTIENIGKTFLLKINFVKQSTWDLQIKKNRREEKKTKIHESD